MNTSTSTTADHTCAAVQVGPAVYSVKTFCDAHDITKVTFYKLLKDGTAPRIMKVGARTLIPEAELRKFVADKMGIAA